MQATYYTQSGDKLSLYLWFDLFRENTYRDKIKISKINNKNVNKVVKIHKDNDGKFFNYKNEKIYIENFEHLSAKELVDLLANSHETDDWVDEDTILACILKESDNLYINCPLAKYETIVPLLNLALTGNEYNEVLCKFVETYRYEKSEWNYKITLSPVKTSDTCKYSDRTFYFTDLCQMLRQNRITLQLAN